MVLKDTKQEKLKELDEEYIYSRSDQHQTEIFDAIFKWEEWFPDLPLPKAAKLDEWLQEIRSKDSYWKGQELINLFENALRNTRDRKPRDVMGWLTKGFREGYILEAGEYGN